MHAGPIYRRILAGLGLLAFGAAGAETLEELAGQPGRWPSEVILSGAVRATVISEGKPAGMMLLGAGSRLAVSALSAEGVTGKVGSTLVRVPAEKTDLWSRVAAVAPPPAAVAAKPEPAAAPRTKGPGTPAEISTMQRLLLGHLVSLQDGRLQPFDMRGLSGVKFFGIMFSAGWCGPCRQFAPELLDAYRKIREVYPEFQLILVSRDRSPDAMRDYMRDEGMPWPALRYGASAGLPEIERLAGPGIPDLVLVDAEGRVLADSFRGGEYLGPDSVLDATWRALRQNRLAAR